MERASVSLSAINERDRCKNAIWNFTFCQNQGRFISADDNDILQATQGQLLVANNAVTNFDPTGETVWSVFGFTYDCSAGVGGGVSIQYVKDSYGNHGIMVCAFLV